MKKHVKIYLDYFQFALDEYIPCENCKQKAVDIHHLQFKSQLGKDEISNLMALCRKCHEKAHSDKNFNNNLKTIHNEYISN